MTSTELEYVYDAARLRSVADTELLDTPAEECFDRLAKLTARVMNSSMAVISLIDDRRQFVKSVIGMPEPFCAVRDWPLEGSLCKFVVAGREPLVLDDAAADPRVRDNLAAKELGVASYAGVPLDVWGHTVGSLCVIDTVPRAWSPADIELLHTLAATVSSELEHTAARRALAERLAMAQALRDAEEELRLTVENAPIGMALVAPDGRFLRVNEALCTIVGYRRDELLAIDFQHITHPEDLAIDLRFVQELLSGERSTYEISKRYLHRDGHALWIHLSVSLVRSESGEPRFFIAQIQDLSARRKAEAQAQLFFDRSLDMLAVAGKEGRLEQVNDAWVRTLGWSREELTTTPFLDFVHPEDRERTRLEAESAYTGRPTRAFRNRYRATDGVYHWLDWNCYPSGDGRLFCIARDVTTQAEHEQRLHLYQRAMVAATNGIIVTEATSSEVRIVYVNPAFERMTGYPAEELVGESCRKLQGSDREQPEIAELRSAIAERRECHVVLRNYKKTGEMFLNSLTISPIRDAAGTLTHYIGIAEDITQRVQAERAAREQTVIMRAVLDSMNDGVIVADRNERVLLFNDVTRRMLNKAPIGETFQVRPGELGFFLADKRTPCPRDALPIVRALRGESVDQMELWVQPPGASEGRWHSVTGNPIRDADGQVLGAVTVRRDITSRKAMEEQIQKASVTDELTGLYNRRGFSLLAEQQLRVAVRNGRPLTLLFLDLNGMKRINDELGHEMGDRALIETAALLRKTCRSSDVIARLGGDEFVILTEDGSDDAEALAKRIADAAERAARGAGRPHPLSLSIGSATHRPSDRSTLAELLAAADEAMYKAKRARPSRRPGNGAPAGPGDAQ